MCSCYGTGMYFIKRALSGAGAGAGNSQTRLRIAKISFARCVVAHPPSRLPLHLTCTFSHTVYMYLVCIMRIVISD